MARDQLKGIDPALSRCYPRIKNYVNLYHANFGRPPSSPLPGMLWENFRRNVKPLYEITPSAIYIRLSYGGDGGTCGARKVVKSILSCRPHINRVSHRNLQGYIEIFTIIQAKCKLFLRWFDLNVIKRELIASAEIYNFVMRSSCLLFLLCS